MCCYCEGKARRHGRDRRDNQRYRCGGSGRTFLEDRPRPFGDMRIDHATAVLALKMLAEGCSIRAVERLTDLHRNTICRLLVTVGQRMEKLMEARIFNVPAREVQCDEMWGFVGMKQRTKRRRGIDDPCMGDAWCFVALERRSKLVLAWHLAFYNFARIHGSLRVTAAIEASGDPVTKHALRGVLSRLGAPSALPY